MRKLCNHISYAAIEKRYYVYEPAVIKPDGEKMVCSTCGKEIPVIKRRNGAMRIRLVPLGKTGKEKDYQHRYTIKGEKK